MNLDKLDDDTLKDMFSLFIVCNTLDSYKELVALLLSWGIKWEDNDRGNKCIKNIKEKKWKEYYIYVSPYNKTMHCGEAPLDYADAVFNAITFDDWVKNGYKDG